MDFPLAKTRTGLLLSATTTALLTTAVALPAAQNPTWLDFEKAQLSDAFYSEGASTADFDGDGHGDIVSGPVIYFGPTFEYQVEFYEPKAFPVQQYSNNFFAFTHDFDADGLTDILVVGFPGQDATWFKNPGNRNPQFWTRLRALDQVDNESPQFTDLTGDGQPELICMSGGHLGWADFDPQQPAQKWNFHPVSEGNIGGRFTHGLGIGDVNGDGRQDLLMKQGWWSQPQSLDGDPKWSFHAFPFANRGGAQMFVYDVDGDGDADVITADNAHGYGLAWFEQLSTADQKASAGAPEFAKHSIMGAAAAENAYSVVIGNLHAMDMADMDGDGLMDLITGARFWAHGGNDAADHEPSLLYWLRLQRTSAGAEFVPHLIDDDSGVGTQVLARDVDGDGAPDVVVGNKNGTFVHYQRRANVAEWDYRARMLQAVQQAKNRVGGMRVQGVVPTGADGKPMNLGFESGDLSHWTATGEAFNGQPVQGDTVRKRRPESRSKHDGNHWMGGFELHGDGPTGTLTSAPFEVTHPFASFLVGGGPHDVTCVQVLDAENGDVLYQASGKETENMHVRWVDLRQRVGKRIQIKLIDNHTGHWGHVNYDDFRFHAETAEIKKRAEEDMPQQMVKGFTPQQAAERMTVPDGFHVDVVAGEPDLHQPIAMTIDARGRIWVAEAYAYPVRRKDEEAKDHILVFEDKDKNGSFETRTVFLDNLNLVSGIEVGFGGVWIGAAPYLMFVPDANDDLIPDSEPEILLDGWGYQDTHETLNAFNWGPDGWLYGCHGVFTHSRVGKPGTPDDERMPLNAGVWRYHPQRHHFEVFAWGSSNPWGVVFDENGQALITACVIPHLYHMIQGGRYQRQGGRHFNPFVYDDIKTVADHLHYLGATPHSGNGFSDSVGGGHAHCGAAIYLGDQFPEEYHNRLFVFNVHGKRMNSETLSSKGSGLVGSHAPDFMVANDKWFLGVAVRGGPDGSMYFIDWYDKQACHRREVEIWDRSNGRLYRARYGDLQAPSVNIPDLSDAELVQLLVHDNEWWSRQARLEIQHRYGNRTGSNAHADLQALLKEQFENQSTTPKRLRSLWAMHAAGVITLPMRGALLRHSDEYVRAWTLQLGLDAQTSGTQLSPEFGSGMHLPTPDRSLLASMVEMAVKDPSPVVRLYLASALQRISVKNRRSIALGLMAHQEDADDHNLPLMIWYGYQAVAAGNPEQALADVKRHCTMPQVQDFTYRRLASGSKKQLNALCEAIAKASPFLAERMIAQLSLELQSRPETKMPRAWRKVSKRFLPTAEAVEIGSHATEIPEHAIDQLTALALQFGDRNAAPRLRQTLMDAAQATERRIAALDGLVQVQDAELLPLLYQLLHDDNMRTAALPKLAVFQDEGIAGEVLKQLATFSPSDQAVAASTLAARPETAGTMLLAMLSGDAPRELLNSATLRQQLLQLNNDKINDLLTSAWGRSTEVSEQSAEKIQKYKELLSPEYLATADLSNGRLLYNRTCFACHDLFGEGLEIGPGLTGSNRADMDYILSNIIEPSAEVGREYLMTTITLQDGRVVSGMVMDENNHTITLQSGSLRDTVRKSQIQVDADGKAMIMRSALSLMPIGQLQGLNDEQVRDLIAYLASPNQVPLPEGN